MANERERLTSNKAGVKSLGKKLDNSRHGFKQQPAAGKIAGAFAHEDAAAGRTIVQRHDSQTQLPPSAA